MHLRLNIHHPTDGEREYATKQPLLEIGRDPQATLSLLDSRSTVSWRHARIDLRGGTARIEDLDSTNGTYLNGHRLVKGKPAPLHLQDVIQFGLQGPHLTVSELDLSESAAMATMVAPMKHDGQTDPDEDYPPVALNGAVPQAPRPDRPVWRAPVLELADPDYIPGPERQSDQNAAGPQDASGTTVDDLLTRILRPNEQVLALIAGLKKWHDFFEMIPLIRLIFQMARRPFVAVVTTDRLILIERMKGFNPGAAKDWTGYRLDEIDDVTCEVHLLSSTVTIRTAGTRHQLRDVNKDAGPAFRAAFQQAAQPKR
jgi:FHA domain/Bacterial PH domain